MTGQWGLDKITSILIYKNPITKHREAGENYEWERLVTVKGIRWVTGCFLDCFLQLTRPLLFSGVFFFISGSNGSLGHKSLISNVHLTYTCSFYAYFPNTIDFLTISLIFMAKLKGITFSPYPFLVTARIWSLSILLLFFQNVIKLSFLVCC